MQNTDLVENGLTLLNRKLVNNTAVSPTTLLQRYDANNSQLHAYLIASRLPSEKSEQRNILQLYRKMKPLFNESELREVCFELSVNYEDLNGRNRQDNIRELITYMQRRQKLPDLMKLCQEKRPHVSWELDQIVSTETAVQPKLDIAVVINIARHTLRDVAAYLDDRGIDVNFILFRHAVLGQFFSVDDDWQALAITFGDVMAKVKRTFDGAKIHFFMAAPSGLLFAMGCIWGTVDDAIVYHYEDSTYYPVLPITRELRKILSSWE